MSVSKEIKVAILRQRLQDHEASLFNAQVEANLAAMRGLDELSQTNIDDAESFKKTVAWLEGEIEALENPSPEVATLPAPEEIPALPLVDTA